jgi:NTP pyrophosphatase (non-canonical NTP hydrolase)
MTSVFIKQAFLQRCLRDKQGVKAPETVGEVCDTIHKSMTFFQLEAIELMEEIAGSKDILKPWKENHAYVASQQFKTSDSIKSEAMDVLCFALNICLLAGITPTNIDQEYQKVWDKNIDRCRNGY